MDGEEEERRELKEEERGGKGGRGGDDIVQFLGPTNRPAVDSLKH